MRTNGKRPRSVALVSSYPPTACGLATFASNLRDAIRQHPGWEVGVVRMLDEWEPAARPEVVEEWVACDPATLDSSLLALSSFDAVILQHEYGLYPGRDGDEVLTMIDGLEVPLIAVLHTALLDPSPHQREVLDRVLDTAAVTVVQSEAARRRILAVHARDPDDIVVVPHGAVANFSGPVLDAVPRPAVLTWGLLGPGKGIEHGIAAVAGLAPPASYVIAGRTHPKVWAATGESYRDGLRALARSVGAADRVHFDDGYRDWDSLRALVRSVDVVLLPYESRDHVSSGVLVEALASGKPVVATRFPHAEELLADGAGFLVDHGDVAAMTAALRRVLHEPGQSARMAAAAREAAAPLLWPAVGASYRELVERVVRERAVA